MFTRQKIAYKFKNTRCLSHKITDFQITECIACFVCLALIAVIVVSGTVGSNLVTKLIKWKYPRLERSQASEFTLLLFVIISVLLVLNTIIFDVVFRTQLYFRRRAMSVYQIRRRVVMRRVIIQ